MSAGRRIAVMGGTFNPIHTGHAIIARHIAERDDVDMVWLLVAPQNPLKEIVAGEHVDDVHRLAMTELVARRIEGVITSAFEFQLPRPSYTVDTLAALREKFPDDEFALVIGADNWALWERWKNGDEILAHHRLLVYPRRGYDITVPDRFADRVIIVDAPIIEISSTTVRARLNNGLPVDFLIPDDVNEYIQRNKLYINL